LRLRWAFSDARLVAITWVIWHSLEYPGYSNGVLPLTTVAHNQGHDTAV
jgi:hypothetical protein